MNRADKETLDSLEQFLVQMHQVQCEPDFTLSPPYLGCPSHESAFDEEGFKRVFGVGDEQQIKPRRYNQTQFDHGCKEGDF